MELISANRTKLLALLNDFSNIDLFTVAASLLLFLAARPICSWLSGDNVDTRTSMMRILNALIIIAILAKTFVFQQHEWLPRVIRSLITLYFAVLLTQVTNFFIRKRFGKIRTSNSKTTISDTYASRGLSLFVAVLIAVVALVSCLKILGFNSLLEAGGALGIIGLFLAMTQGAWAPDIISGLIILNSRMCEEGDVVQFTMNGKTIISSIFKTKTFHTECLDLANNHRIMIRNSKLRDMGVHNLSRFASAKGLRECLLFNIDYKHSENQVTEMFNRAFAEIDAVEDAREEQYAPEIRVYNTGDYAITWAVFYYIKDVKNLLSIRQLFRSYVLAESTRSNISLATPLLHVEQQ